MAAMLVDGWNSVAVTLREATASYTLAAIMAALLAL
jgi:hypothetical protein